MLSRSVLLSLVLVSLYRHHSSLSVLLSVLLCGLIHWWKSGWRAVRFRWRSSLGGILVLAVVGLGLGAAALAVADAALAPPALLACLSEAMLPRGATVGVRSQGFFCVAVSCCVWFGFLGPGLLVFRVVVFDFLSASLFHSGHFPSAIALLALVSLSFSSIFFFFRAFFRV